MSVRCLLCVLLTLFSGHALAESLPDTPDTFATAEKLLYRTVYADHRVDLYCGCQYDEHLQIDAGGCGLRPRLNARRALRIEVEHIVPARRIGEGRACWRTPAAFAGCTTASGRLLDGRDCCLKVDPAFLRAHNDLYNLAPAAGELNGDRSDRPYGRVQGEPRVYGRCDFEVDFRIDRTEPPPSARGLVARVGLYMATTYGLTLDRRQRALFTAWDRRYPVSDWERTRAARIAVLQKQTDPLAGR